MDILKLDDLTVEEILTILDEAEKFKIGEKKINYNGEKVIANLFFEPSTRTHYSFETAALKLGCKTINFQAEMSSMQKGESLYDTVKTFESLGANAFVIRSKENEYYKQLKGINVPILNAGDGTCNHPSQSLLDLFTIKEHFGKLEGINVSIIGDIKHSRVAHTNIDVMKRLGMNVFVSAPEEYQEEKFSFISIDEAVEKSDVIMLLRVQHERHDKQASITGSEYNKKFGMNIERVKKMKENAIIMHPAPFNRNIEITDEVVECEKSKIFEQMKNGVFVRMELINRALNS